MLRKQAISVLICFLSSFHSYTQFVQDSILIENIYRYFQFQKPQFDRPNKSLVFILHGSGGSGNDMIQHSSRLLKLSEKEDVIIVYPEGYKHFWNECRKLSSAEANQININENLFFNNLINYFFTKYHIDTSKVFAIGFSGGGHMAYKLALTMPYKFKAVTAIVANLPDSSNMDCMVQRVPIAVMIINGTNDGINPYKGGEVIIPNTKLGTVRSTDLTFSYWASLNGYTGKARKIILADKDTADGKQIEKYIYSKKGKPETVLLKVINGKHDYPNDLDVFITAWQFFKKQKYQKK